MSKWVDIEPLNTISLDNMSEEFASGVRYTLGEINKLPTKPSCNMNMEQAIANLRELQQFLDDDSRLSIEFAIAAFDANNMVRHIFETAETTEELFYKLRDLFGGEYSKWEIDCESDKPSEEDKSESED